MKFRDTIKEVMSRMQEMGLDPLMPNLYNSNENKDKSSNVEGKYDLAEDHFKAIQEADALYVITPNGYMGSSCKIELGYALALNKRIYFSEPTNEVDLDCFADKFISVDKLHLISSDVINT